MTAPRRAVTAQERGDDAAKLAALTGWFVCILALAGWLALAIHRHHLAGTLVTATALVLLVAVPPLARRVNPAPD